MNYRQIHLLFYAIIISLFSIGCEDIIENEKKGSLTFSFSTESNGKKKLRNIEDAFAIIVSLEDELGNIIYEHKQLQLLDFNGQFISEPLPLLIGNYSLTEFLVVNDNFDVIFATPISGSILADYVETPLPLDVIITEDVVTNIVPQVIPTEGLSPYDLGYATFSLEVIEVFEVTLSVMIYNTSSDNLEFTESHIIVEDIGGGIYETDLSANKNNIILRTDYEPYQFTISKEGYKTYTNTYTYNELSAFSEENPLVVVLEAEGQFELVLQPNADEGKDAKIWSSSPDSPGGSWVDFVAMAWTWHSNGLPPGARRSLIHFDLSSIPEDAIITDANLYLYYNPTSPDFPSTQGHNVSGGSNESILQRITSPWDEMTVTWNNQPSITEVNQVYVPGSTSSTEDYQIDVTSLVDDMIKNPDTSHGFMYSLITEQYYRAMIFASSDHEDNSLHPKLIVNYSLP